MWATRSSAVDALMREGIHTSVCTRRFKQRASRLASCGAILLGVFTLGFASLACEEPKPEPPKKLEPKPPIDPPESEPPAKKEVTSLPPLRIDDVSAQVGPTRAFLTNSQGQENALEIEQLRSDLERAKAFINGQSVTIEVHRKARVEWIHLFLKELFVHQPSAVKLQTETRPDFPKAIDFVAESSAKSLPSCTLVAFISKDRSTAVWKLSGGAARKRPRGLSGPDLSRTADTIKSAAKGCKSDVLLVQAVPEVEWGMIYDLAGAGMTAGGDPGLKHALLPKVRPTPGQPLSFD